jgi:hypothetical protein
MDQNQEHSLLGSILSETDFALLIFDAVQIMINIPSYSLQAFYNERDDSSNGDDSR